MVLYDYFNHKCHVNQFFTYFVISKSTIYFVISKSTIKKRPWNEIKKIIILVLYNSRNRKIVHGVSVEKDLSLINHGKNEILVSVGPWGWRSPGENKELVSSEAPTMAQLFHDSQSHDQPPHIYYVHKTLGFHWRTRMKKEVVRKMKGEVSHELQVNAPARKTRELNSKLEAGKTCDDEAAQPHREDRGPWTSPHLPFW